METPFDSTNALDCAYFLSFGIGIVWALFVVITGGLGGDVDVPDADVPDFDIGDVDTFDVGSVEVSPISPITISTFITSFGAVGIIVRQLFNVSGPFSLLWSTAGGLLLASIMFLFYSRFLIGSQGSSEVRVGQLVGLTAEVIAPIAEEGIGEIAVVAQGSRVTYPARSSQGTAIKRGTLVIIDQMLGTQALVSPKDSGSQPSAPLGPRGGPS
jgi:membrane protein implicated in regulation of membrane protease activity